MINNAIILRIKKSFVILFMIENYTHNCIWLIINYNKFIEL